jgi:hypothetical protein
MQFVRSIHIFIKNKVCVVVTKIIATKAKKENVITGHLT